MSIPEDFGNRGESTITKLPMSNKQLGINNGKSNIRPNHGESNDGVCVFTE